MKIATWNLERLKHFKQLNEINDVINTIDADILVLTETDSRIELSQYENLVATKKLDFVDNILYKPTEVRVQIFSKYRIIQSHNTFDNCTSCCVTIDINQQKIVVYGTIIGAFGNRNKNFESDLAHQLLDFDYLSKNNNLCIVGDYNQSFADNYYFTNAGRQSILDNFFKNNLAIVTNNVPQNVDHIAISKKFVQRNNCIITTFNNDKKLSDHIGVVLEI